MVEGSEKFKFEKVQTLEYLSWPFLAKIHSLQNNVNEKHRSHRMISYVIANFQEVLQ